MLRHPLILSVFLFFFLPPALAQTAAWYDMPDSRFDTLADDIEEFKSHAVQVGLASDDFSDRINQVLNEARVACPPDFGALLEQLEELFNEIANARHQVSQLQQVRKIVQRSLDWAVKNERSESAEKFMKQLDEIDAEIAPLDRTASMLSPEALDDFRNLYAGYIDDTCPQGMAYIDGTFCIDIYEYPNEKGKKPVTGLNFQKAEKLCRENGKRLCSGGEWMRVCSGHDCRPYHLSMRPFDPDDCFADIDYYPGTPPLPSGSTPACDTPEGVSEILGNAWEWTSESYREDYYIVQGGVHMHSRSPLCTNHKWMAPDAARPYFGVRCCSDPAPPPPPAPPEEETGPVENTDAQPESESPSPATGTEKM